MEATLTAWPNNKKLVVMVTIMFEVWSDGKAPPYSPMTTSLKPGTPGISHGKRPEKSSHCAHRQLRCHGRA